MGIWKRTAALIMAAILALTATACAPEAYEDANYSYSYEAGSAYDYSYGGERYLDIVEQGERDAAREPKATISLKVDTAAYSNVRRYLENGTLPPADAVRTEELINYFDYDMQLEPEGDDPFAVYTELGPSPIDPEKTLAFIRIKTEDIDKDALPPSNLVFLIDTSGSMGSYDKLPLLQNAFALLVEELDEDDRVSIVTYAGSSSVVLEGARGSEKSHINSAIFDLGAGGSTAGAEGIQTAYAIAQSCFIKNGNNRVILATDGDFNVGISDTDELADFIAAKRDTGVYLSILGFGTGNIRDDIMETLSKEGNGNYSYINSLTEAEKVLVTEMGGTMFTVADDVKAQVEFDPDVVESYRLIGYENRMLDNEDFKDDSKDAGEIGAGSDIIVLFELTLMSDEAKATGGPDANARSSASPFDLRIRYKRPGENSSTEMLAKASGLDSAERNSTDFGFASSVALLGDLLRHSEDNAPAASQEQIEKAIGLAKANLGKDGNGYRKEYLDLLYSCQELL